MAFMQQLVQYSDSSDGEDDGNDGAGEQNDKESVTSVTDHSGVIVGDKLPTAPAAKKPRLELPSDIRSMFADSQSEVEVKDNPDDHQGRKRSFAHVPGNWATHVYIPIPQEDILRDITDELMRLLPTPSEWHKMESLHLSLSKTVAIRHHCIEPLRKDLIAALDNVTPRFTSRLDSVHLYVNDEKTRTFLGLCVSSGQDKLKKLVKQVDHVFGEYRLDKYYENPSFHVSVGWACGSLTSKMTPEIQRDLQLVIERYSADCWANLTVDAQRIETKCGDKIFLISTL